MVYAETFVFFSETKFKLVFASLLKLSFIEASNDFKLMEKLIIYLGNAKALLSSVENLKLSETANDGVAPSFFEQ